MRELSNSMLIPCASAIIQRMNAVHAFDLLCISCQTAENRVKKSVDALQQPVSLQCSSSSLRMYLNFHEKPSVPIMAMLGGVAANNSTAISFLLADHVKVSPHQPTESQRKFARCLRHPPLIVCGSLQSEQHYQPSGFGDFVKLRQVDTFTFCQAPPHTQQRPQK